MRNNASEVAPKKRFGLILGLTTAAFVSVVAAVLLPQAERAHDAAQASKCNGHFSCIAVAMRDYHSRHGHFPPAFVAGKDGKPAHSWRVLLLETLDAQTFEEYRFDEPWDGPNNRKHEQKMPSCYACPADSDEGVKWRTNYCVAIGPGTVFPGSKTVKIDDIKRPHSETILLVETIGQGVHWMEPKDLAFEKMSFELNDTKKPSVSSHHNRGPGAFAVDGSMLWLAGISPERLQEQFLITKQGSK